MAMNTLETKHAECLLNSSKEVFETMINMAPNTVRGGVDSVSPITAEVVGTLGFTGTRSGIFVMSTSLQLAKAFCGSMLFMEPDEIEDNTEVADAFGEIANMIVGNFKNSWVDEGNEMDLAIPSVTFGAELALSTGNSVQVEYAAQLEFDLDTLRVDFRFHA